MSKQKERDQKMIREVTDDLLKSKFISEVGQKARVSRSSIQSEYMQQLREVIRDVGLNLLDTGVAPKGMQYMGSLSVHVYKSEILKTAAFATVSALGEMPFDLADGALRELTGNTLETYGRSRQKLRSGF